MFIGIDTNILINRFDWFLEKFGKPGNILVVSTVTVGELYPSDRDRSAKEREQEFVGKFDRLISAFGKKYIHIAPPWTEQIETITSGTKNSEITRKLLSSYQDQQTMQIVANWERDAKEKFAGLSEKLPSSWEGISKGHSATEIREKAVSLMDDILFNTSRDWTSLKDTSQTTLIFSDKAITPPKNSNSRPLALSIFLFESIALGQLFKHVEDFESIQEQFKHDEIRGKWLSAFKAKNPVGFADAVIAVELFYCDLFITDDDRLRKALELAAAKVSLKYCLKSPEKPAGWGK